MKAYRVTYLLKGHERHTVIRAASFEVALMEARARIAAPIVGIRLMKAKG